MWMMDSKSTSGRTRRLIRQPLRLAPLRMCYISVGAGPLSIVAFYFFGFFLAAPLNFGAALRAAPFWLAGADGTAFFRAGFFAGGSSGAWS